MREFFTSRRRTAGLALLVVAIVLTGLWTRSFTACDELTFLSGTDLHAIASAEGLLLWTRFEGTRITGGAEWSSRTFFGLRPIPLRLLETEGTIERHDVKEWQVLRFGTSTGIWESNLGTNSQSARSYSQTWIPYWIFVFPLIVTDIVLLTRKPRSAARYEQISKKSHPNQGELTS